MVSSNMSWTLQNAVIFILFLQTRALLEIAYPELEDDFSAYTSVRFLGGQNHDSRRKREVGECFQDVLSFNITVDGRDMTLQLEENTKIDLTKPILVADENGVVARTVSSLVETKCFQDLAQDAAIGVTYRRLPEGDCEYFLEGTFSDSHGACVIQPSGRRQGKPDNHVVRRMNSTIDFLGDFVEADDAKKGDDSSEENDGKKPIKSRRRKRQALLHEIELFLVVDSLVYDFWIARVDGGTAEIKQANALDAINRYYAYIVNGMDLRYRSIADQDIAFGVLNSGLYVATTAAMSPFTVGISSPNPDNPERPLVNGSETLSAFRTFVRSNSALLKPSDHTMLFSKADFFSEGDAGQTLAGLAYVSRTCTDSSVSFSEDLFNFITITIASHELGHCMGAAHDGTGNTCLSTDKFIMSTSATPVLGDNAGNPWLFSNCSLEYFRTYVNTLNDAGNNCLLTRDPAFDPSAVDSYLAVEAGQFYSIDDQCRYTWGNGSYFCRSLFRAESYPEVCQRAYCSVPGETFCRSIVPARRTSCGDSKWCVDSQCTTDPNAPTGITDACPFGDQPGEISDGATCQDTTAIDCYSSSYSGRCCQTCATFETGIPDCLYGDKNVGCLAFSRSGCYLNEATCCGTCAPLKASDQIGCEFGDRATGCTVQQCPTYNEATLQNCCETCQFFSTPATTTAVPTTTATETTTNAVPITTAAETTTTSVPTTIVAETTTTAKATTTAAETSMTTAPTTTLAEATTTAVPTTTVAETTTAMENTTPAATSATTTTVVEATTTAVPTTTVAETTVTSMASTTTAETSTTSAPTTTVAEATTTVVPTTTVAETTVTSMASTTTAETSKTAAPTTTVAEATTTVVPTTTTVETTSSMPSILPTTATAETTTTLIDILTNTVPITTTAKRTSTAATRTTERETTTAEGCVYSGSLPFVSSQASEGACDTRQRDCTVTTLNLLPRTPVDNTVNLTCHFRQITVNEVDSRLTGFSATVPGVFVRCDQVQCQVPDGTIPFTVDRQVLGWLISVSNDGVAYGNEVVYLAADGQCVSCRTKNPPVCTWEASYCYVGGACYANGIVNPSNECEQCDSAGSPTGWAAAAGTCTIGGTCVPNGTLNPDNSCEVCNGQDNPSGFSARRDVCDIDGRCYRDGEKNPDNACQICDIASPATWKTSAVKLLSGGEAPCESFCTYLLLYMPDHLDDIVCKYGGLPDTLIPRVCLVDDPTTVPELNCRGTETILPRYLAFCGHTVYEEARADPIVCPT